MAVFGGSGGEKLQNQKIRLCNHKTQRLSRITFTVSIKIKPDNQMYANVSDPPPPMSSKNSIICLQIVYIIHKNDGMLDVITRTCYVCIINRFSPAFIFIRQYKEAGHNCYDHQEDACVGQGFQGQCTHIVALFVEWCVNKIGSYTKLEEH